MQLNTRFNFKIHISEKRIYLPEFIKMIINQLLIDIFSWNLHHCTQHTLSYLSMLKPNKFPNGPFSWSRSHIPNKTTSWIQSSECLTLLNCYNSVWLQALECLILTSCSPTLLSCVHGVRRVVCVGLVIFSSLFALSQSTTSDTITQQLCTRVYSL